MNSILRSVNLGLAIVGGIFLGDQNVQAKNPENLITNGGFESGNLIGWIGTSNTGTATGNNVVPSTQAIAGGFSMVFNGGDTTPWATISQTFKTKPNTRYTLTFNYASFYGEPFTWATPQKMQVAVSNSSLIAPLDTSAPKPSIDAFQFDVLGPVTTYTYYFVARGKSCTLTFSDHSANNTISEDGWLDEVSVVATGHANNGKGNGGEDGVPGKSGKSDQKR